MALVTTMSGVIGVLAAMAVLLWFSAYIEDRQLGPVVSPGEDRPPMRLVEDAQVPAEVSTVLATADAAA